MSFKEIIAHKRDGHALSVAEIELFVRGLADGSLPAEQVSALAMAILWRGMDVAETGALTRAMAHSGATITFDAGVLGGPVVDKHSTGGVGDKTSFLVAPIVAACGGYVPMISGRGLGHTGGTLDKLDAIPGYESAPDLARFKAVVADVGCAIIGQTADLAPADRRLYAVRDVTGTVESIPLITASILSKKLASGTRALVMDVKTGSGAFMPTFLEARALALAIIGTAGAAGLPTRALVTDMGQTLGSTAGNALEIVECVAYLAGGPREARLDAVTLALAAEMLVLTGLATDREEATLRADAAVRSGAAAERFQRMVAALGGPADFAERPDRYLPQAAVTIPVIPERGYLAGVDARALGNALVALGAGRARANNRLDLSVGFADVVTIGAQVGPERPLMTVRAASREAAECAVAAVLAACLVADEAPPPTSVIHAMLPEAAA